MSFRQCGNDKSLFELIYDYWGNLREIAHTFHRICTVMRLMGVQTVVIEKALSDEEKSRLEEEATAIQKRLGAACHGVEFTKFTFLRCLTENAEELALNAEDSFLGYAILVNVVVGPQKNKWSYIFEAIIHELESPSGGRWHTLDNQYLHVKRKFHCRVGTRNYDLNGSYFRQQNGITNICGHACVCMMLNNVPNSEKIFTAEQINRYLHYDHKSPAKRFRLPKRLAAETNCADGVNGIHIEDIALVFKKEGFQTYQIPFNSLEHKRSYRAAIYSFVESRFPALMSFGPANDLGHADEDEGSDDDHVFTVVGHTLSPHSWLPKGYDYDDDHKVSYVSSLAWIDHWVIHDDNFGMQFTFPAHTFNSIDRNDTCTPKEGLGIFPVEYGIQMPGEYTIPIAASFLRRFCQDVLGTTFNENNYSSRLLKRDGKSLRSDLVFRPVLIRWHEYVRCCFNENISPATATVFEKYDNAGIDYVWLVEVTESDLFVGNQAKVIDVILNPKFPVIVKDKEPDITETALILIGLPKRAIELRNSEWQQLPSWLPRERHQRMFQHPKGLI